HMPNERRLLEEAFSAKARRKVSNARPHRRTRRRQHEHVARHAKEALARHDAALAGQGQLLMGVADLLVLDEPPARGEAHDNSHFSGTNMVGAMIVADAAGLRKSANRKFNIKTADAADDTGMMREVLERRFKRALKEGADREGASWPDLILI